jgi:hypothetical protein
VSSDQAPSTRTPTAAGWRHAAGDPDDTVRYWDGHAWWGDPVSRFDRDSARGTLVMAPETFAVAELAPMTRRAFATTIDAIIAAAAAYAAISTGLLSPAVNPTDYQPEQYLTMLGDFTLWVLAAATLWVLIDLASTVAIGRSIGKSVTGLATVPVGTRDRLGVAHASVRSVLKCLAMPTVTAAAYATVLMLTAQQQPAIAAGALTLVLFGALPYASIRRRAPWDLAARSEVISAT